MSGFYPLVFVNIQKSRHCLVTGKTNILMSLRCGGTQVSQISKKKYPHNGDLFLFVLLFKLSSKEVIVLRILE